MFSASKTAGPSGYNINNSLRFRSSASAYLNRTLSTPTNNKIWTWSGWVKRGALAGYYTLFSSASPGTGFTTIRFTQNANDDLAIFQFNGSSYDYHFATSQVFRDPASWYHIVVAMDTTQATNTNRMKLYVNGNQVTAFSSSPVGVTYPTQNLNTNINSAVVHRVGAGNYTGNVEQPFDGYMTEINFIDGQALTPSSFGSTNATTGVWQPARYTGTYGANGFYLPFSDIGLTSGSNTGLGKDFSGNGNFWNTNNISVTSGVTYDAMSDVPTLTSATVANYAVMNPLVRLYGTATLSDANLKINDTSTGGGAGYATIAVTSGKFYYEFTPSAVGKLCGMGVTFASTYTFGYDGCYLSNGTVSNTTGGTATTYASYTTNDIIGVAFDADAGKVWFYKNGTLQAGDPVAGTSPAFTWAVNSLVTATYAMDNSAGTVGINANFGQRPFSYTPPTGYNRLNTFNLPTSTIVKGNTVMDATLATGNNSTQVITNAAGFRPDFVWLKIRSASENHIAYDSVRGAQQYLVPNLTLAEATLSSGLTSFNSNGFTLGNANPNYAGSPTFVAWQWQAGQGTNTTNTAGSITSTVSVNTTAGFSIVTYTGNGAIGATVGHGLGVAPSMIILKRRTGSTASWLVWHRSLSNLNNNYLLLDTTNAQLSSTNIWGTQTSSVIALDTDSLVNEQNANGSTYVAYCWAEIAGFSKFGSYTGNGSADGPFVYTGFRPKYIMIKNSGGGATSSLQGWIMIDTSRSPFNQTADALFANNDIASTSNSIYAIDILSNGFKTRGTDGAINESSATYIYMAFAENPFKNALAR